MLYVVSDNRCDVIVGRIADNDYLCIVVKMVPRAGYFKKAVMIEVDRAAVFCGGPGNRHGLCVNIRADGLFPAQKTAVSAGSVKDMKIRRAGHVFFDESINNVHKRRRGIVTAEIYRVLLVKVRLFHNPVRVPALSGGATSICHEKKGKSSSFCGEGRDGTGNRGNGREEIRNQKGGRSGAAEGCYTAFDGYSMFS